MADFATLSQLKAALDITDGSKDAQLTLLNGVASALLVDFMNRDPRSDDFSELVNGLGTSDLITREYPITRVISVSVLSGTSEMSVDLSRLGFDDNIVFLRGGVFPRGRRNVRVVYTAGLDPAPKTLAQAAIYTVRALLTARKLDLNATGESWAGVSSQAWDPSGPGVVPVAARTLLQQYRRLWVPA